MNLDLTAQFIRDYEELQTRSASREEIERLEGEVRRLEGEAKQRLGEIERLNREVGQPNGEVKRLEGEVKRLEGEVKRLEGDSARLSETHQEELKRVRSESMERLERLKETHVVELEQQELTIKRLMSELAQGRKEAEAVRVRIEAEFAKKLRILEEQAKEKVATRVAEMTRRWKGKLEAAQAQALTEVGSQLGKLAYVPLGMRVTALVVDVLLLAIAGAKVRFGTVWGQELPSGAFIVGVFSVFGLRTFVSPGNLLLGISPRHIGADLRPTGRAGFAARLFCGLLHYGPLVATASFAASDPTTTAAWMKLVDWAYHPLTATQGLPSIVDELLKPETPALPGVVLALTLVWWALLLLSILFSPLIYRGTPYFRNTTLVESMWRVGFQRFSPPVLEAGEIEA